MFKKFKLLLFYIKTIKQNRTQLNSELGLSIDWVWRLYKTHTIPMDEMDSVKQFGSSYLEELLKKDIYKIESTLDSLGLTELHTLKEVVELSDRQVGISFEYKHINTAKLMNNSVWLSLYVLGSIIGLILGSYMGVLFALGSILCFAIIRRIVLAVFN